MEKVKRYINKHGLLQPGGQVVVALSGGADSVALLTLLVEGGYHCVAAHCNFHLRSAESDRDMHHVERLCRDLNVELKIRHFDVAARKFKTGESVEMACRSLRYEWFDELLDERPGAVLAVGHHLEDNVETFMLNAMRGSGVTGLKGMLPRNGRVIRPFLAVTRAEIERYLSEKGIEYITDSTNLLNDFSRNRLRNAVIPVLEENFPDAVKGISKSMDFLRDDYNLLTHYDEIMRERYVDAAGVIDVAGIVESHPSPAQVLRRLLTGSRIAASMIDEIVSRPERAGLIFGSYTLDRGKLRPIIGEPVAEQIVVPGEGMLRIKPVSLNDFHPRYEPWTIWLDATALDGNPRWEIRPWRKGDRFRPFGMRGTKLVSDLMADHSLNLNEKKRVKILTRNDEIIWVAPLRASDLFRVTHETQHIIQLSIDPQP